MALGRVVLPRRAIAASSAREGKKVRNVQNGSSFVHKFLENTVLDPILVTGYDSDKKILC